MHGKLPAAKPSPFVTSLESLDADYRICVHELAAALASFTLRSAVPIFGAERQFEEAAESITQILREGPRCPLKGA